MLVFRTFLGERALNDEDSLNDFPLFYRFVLRFPLLSLEGFPEKYQGLFWAVVVPALLAVYFFTDMLLFACLHFPFNLLSVFGLTSVVCLLIIRIYVERMLQARNALFQEFKQREFREVLDDYLGLCEKRDKKDLVGKAE
jgi:hypothetical protein